MVIAVSCLFFPLSPLFSQSSAEKKILVLLPYNADYPAHVLLRQGLAEEFASHPEIGARLYYEYLDIGNFPNSEEYQADVASFLQKKYARMRLDVILSVNLLDRFMERYTDTVFPGVPVIVAWNDITPPGDKLEPGRHILYGTFQFRKTIELLSSFNPETRRLYIVSGDSEVERQAYDTIKKIEPEYMDRLEFVYLNKLSYDDMLSVIKTAPSDSAVFFLWWFSDVLKKPYLPVEVAKKIVEVSPVPVYVTSSQHVGDGCVGGYAYDYYLYGRNSAKQVMSFLAGDEPTPALLEIETSRFILDWKALKRWGISEDKVPEGSKIINMPPDIWLLYRRYLVAASLFALTQSCFILGLFISTRRRKKAEAALLKVNMELVKARNKGIELNRRLDLSARTDYLTGLFNRRHLEERIREEYDRYCRSGESFAVAMVDIDFFKKVNDTWGHEAGDFLLVSLADSLKKLVRPYDTVSRWGGEEFLILLPDMDENLALELSQRIRTRIEDLTFNYNGKALSLALTIGVSAVCPSDTGAEVIRRADEALYLGKRSGRKCVVPWSRLPQTVMS